MRRPASNVHPDDPAPRREGSSWRTRPAWPASQRRVPGLRCSWRSCRPTRRRSVRVPTVVPEMFAGVRQGRSDGRRNDDDEEADGQHARRVDEAAPTSTGNTGTITYRSRTLDDAMAGQRVLPEPTVDGDQDRVREVLHACELGQDVADALGGEQRAPAALPAARARSPAAESPRAIIDFTGTPVRVPRFDLVSSWRAARGSSCLPSDRCGSPRRSRRTETRTE